MWNNPDSHSVLDYDCSNLMWNNPDGHAVLDYDCFLLASDLAILLGTLI